MFLLSSCYQGGGSPSPVSNSESLSLEQSVTNAIAEAQSADGTGVAVAVVYKGETIFLHAYGFRDRGNAKPVTTKTMFPIASASKSFTALLLAKLAEEGKLNLNTPVRTYMADFQLQNATATVQANAIDLLAHRTGLPAHGALLYNSVDSPATTYSRLKFLEYDTRPSHGFRENFVYNNLMYITAGLLAEQRGAKSLPTLYQEKIFGPLGMNQTSYGHIALQSGSDFALPYASSQLIPMKNTEVVGGAGAINSNIEDLTKYLKYLLGGTAPEVLFQAHNPYSTKIHYGLGWSVAKYPSFRQIIHEGHLDGFTSMISFIPEQDIGVVVLTNAHLSGITAHIEEAVYRNIVGINLDARKPGRDPSYYFQGDATPTNPVYAGSFAHPAYGELRIYLDSPTSTNFFALWYGKWFRLNKISTTEYDMMITSYVLPVGETYPLRMIFQLDSSQNATSLTLPLVPGLPITFVRL